MDNSLEYAFLNALDDMFVVFDESGTITEWNDATEVVTEYSAAELTNMTAEEVFTDADSAKVEQAIAELLAGGQPTVEIEVSTKSGGQIPYEFKAHTITQNGTVVYACIGREMTTQQRTTEKLKHHAKVLRKMYEITSDRESSFTQKVESLLSLGRAELNAQYGSLSKIEGDNYIFEIIDADTDDIEPGDVVPLSATNCEITASTEQTLVIEDVEDEPELATRLGYTEWGITCYIGAPVFTDDEVYGTFCFYDTNVRDEAFSEWEIMLVDIMSQWVSYELQRNRTKKILEQQNERLNDFSSIISHDLRNPLGIAVGSLELAVETGDETHLERVQHSLERMDTLIQDMLELAKSGQIIGEKDCIDLMSVAEESWYTVSALDTTLEIPSTRTIRADETRLLQLLTNVFENAIKHGGSDVTVRVGELPNGFYVEDTGVGVSEHNYEQLFERGYSTIDDGTGFGLSIVKEIADAHEWTVTVDESEEGGLRLEFTGSI